MFSNSSAWFSDAAQAASSIWKNAGGQVRTNPETADYLFADTFDSQVVSVQERFPDVNILKSEWITKCIEAEKRLSPGAFILAQPKAQPNKDQAQPNIKPKDQPASQPSSQPKEQPSSQPIAKPKAQPQPSAKPRAQPQVQRPVQRVERHVEPVQAVQAVRMFIRRDRYAFSRHSFALSVIRVLERCFVVRNDLWRNFARLGIKESRFDALLERYAAERIVVGKGSEPELFSVCESMLLPASRSRLAIYPLEIVAPALDALLGPHTRHVQVGQFYEVVFDDDANANANELDQPLTQQFARDEHEHEPEPEPQRDNVRCLHELTQRKPEWIRFESWNNDNKELKLVERSHTEEEREESEGDRSAESESEADAKKRKAAQNENTKRRKESPKSSAKKAGAKKSGAKAKGKPAKK